MPIIWKTLLVYLACADTDELFILSSECIISLISLLGNFCNGALNYADI
jgi:hypothetical protein